MLGFSKTEKYIDNRAVSAAGGATTDKPGSRGRTFVAEIGERRYLSLFITLAAVSNVLALVAVYSYPAIRHWVTEEDNVVENLTVSFFVIALVGTVYLWSSKRVPARFGRWLWFIAPVALLGTLDELSFGQRIFSLESLNVKGFGIDAVHDFLGVGYELLQQQILTRPLIVASCIVALLIIAGATVYYARHWIIHRITRSTSRECWAMLILFFGLVAFSQFLDLDIFPYYRGFCVLIEELFELNAAVLLSFMLLAMTDPLQLYQRQRAV